MAQEDEVLFFGGPIRPIDEPSVVGSRTVEAVLTRGELVVAVGSREECEASATAAQPFDLSGRTMLPGFVDAHTHPLMLGQCVSWADLTGATSMDDVVKILREHANDVSTGTHIRGFGYDHHKLGSDDQHPTAVDLDRVSDSVPVEIMHASGHGYVVNSVSLARAGVTARTPTPEGGRIDRFPSGDPTGVIFDAACDLLTGDSGVKIENNGPNLHLPEDPETLDQMLDLGQRLLNNAGITSVGDCQVTEREMTNWLRCRDQMRLSLRVSMMVLSSHLHLVEGLGLSAALGDDWLRLAGIKLYTDGALTAGMAYVPCGCSMNHRAGRLYHNAEEFTDLVVRAHRLGLQTGTHAQGPEAIGMVIDAIGQAQRMDPRDDVRHRIEHCGFPSDDQIAQMASLQITPVPQPTHVFQYGQGALRDYGDIAQRMYPSGLFAAAGLPVVLSSDVPVSMPDVFLAMWASVTRRTSSGSVIGADCVITREEALRGYTIEGARALHREHQVGSIEPGKYADFAIVDDDPLTCDLDAIPDIKVEETIVGGRAL